MVDAYEIDDMIDRINDVGHRDQLHVKVVWGSAENVRIYYDGSMPLLFKDQTAQNEFSLNINMLRYIKEYMPEMD